MLSTHPPTYVVELVSVPNGVHPLPKLRRRRWDTPLAVGLSFAEVFFSRLTVTLGQHQDAPVVAHVSADAVLLSIPILAVVQLDDPAAHSSTVRPSDLSTIHHQLVETVTPATVEPAAHHLVMASPPDCDVSNLLGSLVQCGYSCERSS